MFGHFARCKKTCPRIGGVEEEVVRACPEGWGGKVGQRGCQLHKGKGQRGLWCQRKKIHDEKGEGKTEKRHLCNRC